MFRAISNPPNPYTKYSVEWLDVPPNPELEIYEEEAKSIISENDSPDIPFQYSVNPYRGCFHGCAYCYARPTHQYIDMGAGTDFERRIVAKINAPELLEKAFQRQSWQGEQIIFSGVTDCYQPIEGSYELTRKCLQVCARYRNPVGVITKGALIRRDIDLLQDLTTNAFASVYISIPFAEDDLSKTVEPFAPRTSTRFRAMEELAKAGVKVGISISPVIPGLNDQDIARLLERAHDAGAVSSFMTILRLPGEVKDIFTNHIEQTLPLRSKKILSAVKEVKDGKLNYSQFGKRFKGQGERWQAIEWIYQSTKDRLGFKGMGQPKEGTFQRPNAQLRLPGL